MTALALPIRRTAVRALSQAEFRAITRSWLVRCWAAFAVIAAILPQLSAAGKEDVISEEMGAWLLIYFIPSAILTAVFGSAAISQDAEIAADSFLTRAVTRADYVVAKLGSRVAVVAMIHFGATIPMLFLSARWGDDDSTTIGLLMASLLVGVMLVFLTALGLFTGAVLRNLAFAVVVIMCAFAAEGLIFGFLEIKEFSPTRVLDELPETIRGDNTTWEEARVLIAFTAATFAAAAGAAIAFQRRDF
jgi:ABC-type transport system involved in multi-copper enzyme maturation permease subunit